MKGSEPLDPVLTGRAGTRLDWGAVPEAVRIDVETRLGAPVASALTSEMGFSPAVAARLELADHRRVFVKAIGPDHLSGAPGGQELYRREARAAASLPEAVPAPRLLGSWELEGWVVLVFEAVEGRPPMLPWRSDELARVLDGLTVLAELLTPAPFDAPPVPVLGNRHWRSLQDRPALLDGLPWVDTWVRQDLDQLVELEALAGEAATGETLVHTDIRADNVLITGKGVVFVDWPHAAIGAEWIDLMFLLPSVAMQGGPEPNETFWAHPVSRRADRNDAARVLAGIAGFFVHGSSQPAPPGLPNLRTFQAAQGRQALSWLRRLLE
ncbi:MAG TPA: aminoglycoside phosphotransferase family protein [Acidimicrobiales bacterium]|nr:aminoglycoside phosphotransferase family protein [Acidimicrobiales bacterium]